MNDFINVLECVDQNYMFSIHWDSVVSIEINTQGIALVTFIHNGTEHTGVINNGVIYAG